MQKDTTTSKMENVLVVVIGNHSDPPQREVPANTFEKNDSTFEPALQQNFCHPAAPKMLFFVGRTHHILPKHQVFSHRRKIPHSQRAQCGNMFQYLRLNES